MSKPTNEDLVAEAIKEITARYWSGANQFAMHAWIVVHEVERLQARVTKLEAENSNWRKALTSQTTHNANLQDLLVIIGINYGENK